MRRENEFRYSQLANILREQILSGYIRPGEYLLSENELCKYYGMSRTSVRKSLEELLKEGLIVKKVGQGTIVSPDLVVKPSEKRVLRILATSPSHFVDSCMPLLIEEFQRDHPGVEIKVISFPTGEFWESIAKSAELGIQPDLVFVTDRQFSEFAHSEQFIDMKRIIDDLGGRLYPRLQEAYKRNGQFKGVPVTFSTVSLAYNPELFQRFGAPEPSHSWSMEQFLEASQQLTLDANGDGINDQYGFSMSSSMSRWPVIALQNGMDFHQNTGFDALGRTLTLIHDLLYRRRIATLSPRYILNSEAFMKGKAAMVLTSAIELAGWRNESLSFEPRFAPLPFGPKQATLLLANAFMIPEASKELELAVRFVEKSVSSGTQARIVNESGFLSVLRDPNEQKWSRELLESIYLNDDSLGKSRFLHEIFPDQNVIDEIESEMTLYWAGLESAEEIGARMLDMLKN
ncbi:extracellular solute-binding protein [Paenibacillus lactis]|uniref:extracellular solute-binding protein n=1 Tax=Paenibacillus lactis TaxID=228574 RepID=UPI00048E773E